MSKEEINAVVFRRPHQGLFAVFGPAFLFDRYSQKPDVSVVTGNELTELSDDFINSQRENGNVYEIKGDAEDNTINVLFLPWSLIPDQFNVISKDHPAQS